MTAVSMKSPSSANADDVVVDAIRLAAGEPEERRVQVDVLAPRELRMEPGSELEEPRHPPALTDQSLGRPKDPGDHLQERALAGAVVPDQREELPLGDVERDVAQGPEILGAGPAGEQTLLQ